MINLVEDVAVARDSLASMRKAVADVKVPGVASTVRASHPAR